MPPRCWHTASKRIHCIKPYFRIPRAEFKASRAIFAAMLKDGMRFGRVLCAYKPALVGVLVWYPPRAYPLSPRRHIRLTPHYLRAAAADSSGLIKFMRALTLLKGIHPNESHCYSPCFGVAPGFQGQGVAPRLVIYLCREADRMRLPIYWETPYLSHLHWYRRLGGRVLQEGLELFRGAPPIWTMWREAQQANAG